MSPATPGSAGTTVAPASAASAARSEAVAASVADEPGATGRADVPAEVGAAGSAASGASAAGVAGPRVRSSAAFTPASTLAKTSLDARWTWPAAPSSACFTCSAVHWWLSSQPIAPSAINKATTLLQTTRR